MYIFIWRERERGTSEIKGFVLLEREIEGLVLPRERDKERKRGTSEIEGLVLPFGWGNRGCSSTLWCLLFLMGVLA